MDSKIEGKNYIVLTDGDKFPVKLNVTKTDKSLARIEKALSSVKEEIMNLYETNYDLYRLLDDEVFDWPVSGFDDGKCSNLDSLIYQLHQLQSRLHTQNDSIPPVEDLITLDDFGYSNEYHHAKIWEKKIEDNDEREVVDEIQLLDPPLRRIRTIEWEKTEHGKSSKKITYKKLSIGKKLLKAAENTKSKKGD